MTDSQRDQLLTAYQQHFHAEPTYFVTAPGRINIIGEHTDYSGGFVLPVAINLTISIALTPRNDQHLNLISIDFKEQMQADLSSLAKKNSGWQEFVKGVAWALLKNEHSLMGWQGVMSGSIPIGAGLSSSAALEVAVAKAFCLAGNLPLTRTDLAKISQVAESGWVGVNVGIMDLLVSAHGKAEHALLLDCRPIQFSYIKIPENVNFVVLDTLTRRDLAGSAYNIRREEVETAANIMALPSLRDATLSLLQEKQALMTPIIFKRAQHVITENQRVLDFSHAMQEENLEEMGRLINQSHTSLRDDFEVSSKELDLIVEIAQSQSMCLGARMTGAGFGGCALALIEKENINSFTENVKKIYCAETGLEPQIFNVQSADGVKAVRL